MHNTKNKAHKAGVGGMYGAYQQSYSDISGYKLLKPCMNLIGCNFSAGIQAANEWATDSEAWMKQLMPID